MKKFLLISSLALVGPIVGSVVACSSEDSNANENPNKVKNPIVDEVTDFANELISFLNKGLINSGHGGIIDTVVKDSEYQINQFLNERNINNLKFIVKKIKTENNSIEKMAVTFSTDTETYQPIEFYWFQKGN